MSNLIARATLETFDNRIIQTDDVSVLREALGIRVVENPTIKEYNELELPRLRLNATCKESTFNRTTKHFIDQWTKFAGPELKLDERIGETNLPLRFINRIQETSIDLARNFIFEGRKYLVSAVRLGYIPRNYFDEIKPVRKSQEVSPVNMQDEHFQLIISNLKEETIKDIIYFSRLTGTRAGEAINLRKKHIDLQRKIIIIGDKSNQTKTKNSRFVPISDLLFEILERRIKKLKDDDYVFSNKWKFPYTIDHVSHTFKKAVRDAKLPESYKLKSLRSTYASSLIMKGMQIEIVSKLLGHRDISTTAKYYSNIEVEKLKDNIIEKLNEAKI